MTVKAAEQAQCPRCNAPTFHPDHDQVLLVCDDGSCRAVLSTHTNIDGSISLVDTDATQHHTELKCPS